MKVDVQVKHEYVEIPQIQKRKKLATKTPRHKGFTKFFLGELVLAHRDPKSVTISQNVFSS